MYVLGRVTHCTHFTHTDKNILILRKLGKIFCLFLMIFSRFLSVQVYLQPRNAILLNSSLHNLYFFQIHVLFANATKKFVLWFLMHTCSACRTNTNFQLFHYSCLLFTIYRRAIPVKSVCFLNWSVFGGLEVKGVVFKREGCINLENKSRKWTTFVGGGGVISSPHFLLE